MNNYNTIIRLDLLVLDLLSKASEPMSYATIHQNLKASAQLTDGTLGLLGRTLQQHLADGHILRLGNPSCIPDYEITPKGRAHLIAEETAAVLREHVTAEPAPLHVDISPEDAAEALGDSVSTGRVEPMQVTACHRTEPPSVALCHLDEAHLDDWWNGLDVELKADAFLGFSLGSGDAAVSFVPTEADKRPAPHGNFTCDYCSKNFGVLRVAHVGTDVHDKQRLIRFVCKDRLCNEQFEDEVDNARDGIGKGPEVRIDAAGSDDEIAQFLRSHISEIAKAFKKAADCKAGSAQ